MKINKKKLANFIKNLTDRIIDHEISTMASSMSYYYLSAAIPFLLVITSIIVKYLEGNKNALLEIISLMPQQTQDLIVPMIDSLLKSQNTATISIITIIIAIWSASKGIQSLLLSINKAYGTDFEDNALVQKVISFFYTSILVFIIVIFMVFRMYGPKIISLIDNFLEKINLQAIGGQITFLLKIVNGFLPLLVMVFALSFLYMVAANRNKDFNITFKEALIGGSFSTLTIFIVSFIYSFFLENISNMPVIYGTLAGFLSLFIWILIFSYSIILGAEIIGTFKEINKINLTILDPKKKEDK